ncbi:MAG: glucose 1-dehydrogenase [Acidobacteriaceae bacterium]|nr:glucose 1-dehydrogenase [Acidobacteriaceae bacterium]
MPVRVTTKEDTMHNLVDLSGKVALITGASSGIGAATALLFAELGARVAIGYHSNQRGADEILQTISQAGGEAISIRADVREKSEITSLISETNAQLGPIDILVNNAGSLIERLRLLDASDDYWEDVLNLNLKSAVFCARAVAPSMIERKTGSIINIVSIAGRNGGGPGAGAYATAKGALITFTKALAKELAPQGVRVNAVSPGVILTPFHDAFSTPEMIRNFVSTIPLGRTGTARETAAVIAFLASEAASYIVGESIEVNGGQLML